MAPRVVQMDAEFVGFGEIVIDGTAYSHDVIIEKGAVRKRRKGPSKVFRDRYGHTPLSTAEDIPWSAAQVVIGTGADGRLPVMDEVRDQAKARGVELIELPTPEAVRLLQSTERDHFNAIIHVTC